jgi:outer membrane protein assembly factor BamB
MRRLDVLMVVGLAGCDAVVTDPRLSGATEGFAYEYDGSNPDEQETPWSDEAQGIARDASSWYISDRWTIYEYGAAADLGGDGYENSVDLPSDCGHFGDIAVAGGLLYAPLEECAGASAARIYVYDAATLEVVGWAPIPASEQTSAPWVAVTADGLLLSSSFDADCLNVFNLNMFNGELELLYRVQLDRAYHAIQGGEIGDDGRLYLISGEKDDSEPPAITILDLHGGAAAVAGVIPVPPVGDGGLELEGLTVWDGTVHWILLDNDLWDRDDATIEHVRLRRSR